LSVGLIGVYGGTFNPIHVGHLRAAEEVAEALGLSRVIFVPSATPPHKSDERDDAIAPAADRLTWVRLAISGNPRFEASAIEVERGGASYLVDTLRELRAEIAPDEAVFSSAATLLRDGHAGARPPDCSRSRTTP
jgi:nicotinate-nucleotide adenylyltransferase